MKEITDKLAYELLAELDKLEKFCDESAKNGGPVKGQLSADWVTASVMCHSLRVHLYWHMQDMIEHPAGPEAEHEGP